MTMLNLLNIVIISLSAPCDYLPYMFNNMITKNRSVDFGLRFTPIFYLLYAVSTVVPIDFPALL